MDSYYFILFILLTVGNPVVSFLMFQEEVYTCHYHRWRKKLDFFADTHCSYSAHMHCHAGQCNRSILILFWSTLRFFRRVIFPLKWRTFDQEWSPLHLGHSMKLPLIADFEFGPSETSDTAESFQDLNGPYSTMLSFSLRKRQNDISQSQNNWKVPVKHTLYS
jgi:hypothetical protein